ncbi:hypothetical protein PV10_06334 [Exophiala mesophila]|uniref:Fe2OG dioxygenase domain-containing protein n=1 Tax=Exophiala mesophila TaxID=212818 RepID=A0A0D1XUG1_EXOME|nr:uncharacterized protein PV10_06334 [Exophiala mesophila]KIV91841.1 hypothetical protein PV10_06334 [Exophiala mesophila]
MAMKSTFHIPTVDISPYIADSTSSAAATVVDQIRAACSTSGFFQIVGHGVAKELQSQVVDSAKAVFSLPVEEKLKMSGIPGRGYEAIGTQALEEGKPTDLKEGFYIGREIPNNKPPYRPFQSPNVWPPTSLISQSCFEDPLTQYHRSMIFLSDIILQILGRGLDHVDTTIFSQFCKDPIAVVRLLHYPPHPVDAEANAVGAGAHTDFGAITLLLQDGHSGLQVLNQDTNEWLDVPPNPDAYVVNVGDMLQIWTAGAYKSNVHRVINTSGTERYSVPFFLDGNADCVIKPLDGSAGKEVTVEEHMLSRFRQTYTTI